MEVINLSVTAHMVIEIESCTKKVWEYQRLEGRKEDYKDLYEVTGKLLFSKGLDFNNHLAERRKRERLQTVTIIVDKDVSDYETVIVQEVIHYGKELVGVVTPSKPKRVEDEGNMTLFTGLVVEEQEVILGVGEEENKLVFTLALVDVEGKGKFRECGVYRGLSVVQGDKILAVDEVHQGSVVRFSVKDGDMEYYEEDEKYIFDEVFIINRYS